MTVTIFSIIDCIWLLKYRLCKLAIAFTEICAATLTWIYWCQLKKDKMNSKIKVNFNIVLRKKRLLNVILYNRVFVFVTCVKSIIFAFKLLITI